MEKFSKVLANKNTLLAYASASLSTMDLSIFKNTVILGKSYLSKWMEIHEIYVSICIAIKKFPDYDIYCTESLIDILNLLLQKGGYLKNAKPIDEITLNKKLEKALIIYDELSYSKSVYKALHSSVVVCFLNITEDYYFFGEKYFN